MEQNEKNIREILNIYNTYKKSAEHAYYWLNIIYSYPKIIKTEDKS